MEGRLKIKRGETTTVKLPRQKKNVNTIRMYAKVNIAAAKSVTVVEPQLMEAFCSPSMRPLCEKGWKRDLSCCVTLGSGDTPTVAHTHFLPWPLFTPTPHQLAWMLVE